MRPEYTPSHTSCRRKCCLWLMLVLFSGPVPTRCPHTVPQSSRVASWQGSTASSACFRPVINGSCCTLLLALSPSRHYRGNDSSHKSGLEEEKCIVYEDRTGMTASTTPTPYKSLPTCNCDGERVEDGGRSVDLKSVAVPKQNDSQGDCQSLSKPSQW